MSKFLYSLLAPLALTGATTVNATSDKNPLEKQIILKDAQLFEAFFEKCEPETAAALLLPNFEMYHDIYGLAAESRDSFISSLKQQCAARKPGGANAGYINRRRIVPGSRIIRKIGKWGALEEASHTFFEKDTNGQWVMVGGARYMHLWKLTDDGLKLAKSYSYDHGAAGKVAAQ